MICWLLPSSSSPIFLIHQRIIIVQFSIKSFQYLKILIWFHLQSTWFKFILFNFFLFLFFTNWFFVTFLSFSHVILFVFDSLLRGIIMERIRGLANHLSLDGDVQQVHTAGELGFDFFISYFVLIFSLFFSFLFLFFMFCFLFLFWRFLHWTDFSYLFFLISSKSNSRWQFIVIFSLLLFCLSDSDYLIRKK